MSINTFLDLPVKDKLASDLPDLMTDQDFELDLRVIVTISTTLPMANNTNTCQITNCGANCHSGTCAYTCGQSCGCPDTYIVCTSNTYNQC